MEQAHSIMNNKGSLALFCYLNKIDFEIINKPYNTCEKNLWKLIQINTGT